MFGLPHLRNILAWPSALEYFSFSDFGLTMESQSHWSMSHLSVALQARSSSLKRITINYISPQPGCIDMAKFTELEFLQLYCSNTDCLPETAASKMLGPKLHTLVMDAGIVELDESFEVFDQREAKWVL